MPFNTPDVVRELDKYHQFYVDLADELGEKVPESREGFRRQAARIAVKQAGERYLGPHRQTEGYVADQTIEVLHTYAPARAIPYAGDADENDPMILTSRIDPIHYSKFRDTPYARAVRELSETLVDQDRTTLPVAFLDDVTPAHEIAKIHNLDTARHARLQGGISLEALEAASQAEYVASEVDYKKAAERDIATIKSMTLPGGYRLSEDGARLIVGSGKDKEVIRLVGYRMIDEDGHPSCPMLDLEWLKHRLGLAPSAITVLPVGYERQQRQVQLLAQLFPSEISGKIRSVFIDQDAKVVSSEEWQWPELESAA